jgi:hypothetical protein
VQSCGGCKGSGQEISCQQKSPARQGFCLAINIADEFFLKPFRQILDQAVLASRIVLNGLGVKYKSRSMGRPSGLNNQCHQS